MISCRGWVLEPILLDCLNISLGMIIKGFAKDPMRNTNNAVAWHKRRPWFPNLIQKLSSLIRRSLFVSLHIRNTKDSSDIIWKTKYAFHIPKLFSFVGR